MIKVRRQKNYTIVEGTPDELARLDALSGIELEQGDKFVRLPLYHHVHRNPRRKPLIKYIEEKDRQEKNHA